MQLPFLKNQKIEKNFFLAFLIKPYRVGAILFEEINNKLFILATKEVDIEQEADTLTSQDLLVSADQAITFVEKSLPEGGSVEKTIFAVPYEWIVDGKISKEHLEKLKKVCQELGLIPMGYLTTIEAIVAFLQHKEGAPVSAIFVEVAQKKVFIYLVRAGKIIEYATDEVSENLTTTVSSLLRKIDSVDVLPSKIVLLEHEGADSSQQEFVSHTWPKEIPFLHVPQVMVLEPGFENEATVNGVATQMDLEVLQDVKTVAEPPEKEDILEEVDSGDFGFAKEKDVAIEKKSSKETEDATPEVTEEVKDEGRSEKHKKQKEEEPNVTYFREDESAGVDEESHKEKVHASRALPILATLSSFTGVVKKIKIPNLPILSGVLSNNSIKTKLIAGAVIAIVVIILVSLAYYNVILAADVSVFADKKAVDKTADVTFAKSSSGDAIPITEVSEELKGDDTKDATGTKETGDKAAGSVTIYNKTESSKNFPKGTIVVGPNNLEFETQSDISIASTSAFATTLSSTSVKVAASKYGKEYNIPSGSNFTVKGQASSNFIAKNSDATSGGTKKTTTVVSKKDHTDLLASVTDKLEEEAVQKAKQAAGSGFAVLPKALSVEIVEEDYSKKVGDEVGSVGVTVTAKYVLAKYSVEDLQKIIKSISAGQVPGTYDLLEGESKIDVTDVKVNTKEDSASAKLHVNAVYIPKIEGEELATQIKGKSGSAATKKIMTITGVTDVVINFKRSIPIFPKLLPFNAKNINVEVKN